MVALVSRMDLSCVCGYELQDTLASVTSPHGKHDIPHGDIQLALFARAHLLSPSPRHFGPAIHFGPCCVPGPPLLVTENPPGRHQRFLDPENGRG